jgi:hypothetical protein
MLIASGAAVYQPGPMDWARIEEKHFPSELPGSFFSKAIRAESRCSSVPRLRMQNEGLLNYLGVCGHRSSIVARGKQTQTAEYMHIEMHAQIGKGRKPQPVDLGQTEQIAMRPFPEGQWWSEKQRH